MDALRRLPAVAPLVPASKPVVLGIGAQLGRTRTPVASDEPTLVVEGTEPVWPPVWQADISSCNVCGEDTGRRSKTCQGCWSRYCTEHREHNDTTGELLDFETWVAQQHSAAA